MRRRRGSRTGGFVEPATASLLTLAGVGAVSGYGANLVNKDQQKLIDEKVRAETANIRDSLDELETLRKNLETETTEKQRLEAKLKALEAMVDSLKREHESSSEKLKKVQSSELLFRNATTSQKKKVFELLKAEFPAAEKEIDEASSKRTLGEVILALVGPTATSEEELRQKLVDALLKAPKLIEEDIASTKAKAEAEKADAKAKAEAERAKPAREKPSARAARMLFGQKPAETVDVVETPVMTPNPMFATTPEPTVVELKEPVAPPTLPSFARKSFDESDAGLELPETKFERELANVPSARTASPPTLTRRRKGGVRKKKLRTRRGVKQNVRRTRSRKNRSDSADSHAR